MAESFAISIDYFLQGLGIKGDQSKRIRSNPK